jgi:alkylation response protein AidB-like acyl-CoA dehydrogenase
MVHGTDEQLRRFMAPIRNGSDIWCQLFSEPGAGSDLASLRTAAAIDGDCFVGSGQKVWTSGARNADWAILLARSTPESTRHDGITYFLLDMHSPGVDVRPLVQINRAAHFNEVFLDEVRIPYDLVVGEVGGGWSVARTTLAAERVMIGSIDVLDRVHSLIDAAQVMGRLHDEVLRQQLADAWIRASTLTYTIERVVDATRLGSRVGPEASVIKLGLSRLMELLGELATRVLGAPGLLSGDGPCGYGPLQDMFLSQWTARIGGGTEQIQRNLIAERSLGLPREP